MASQFFKFNNWLALNPDKIKGAELKLMIFLSYLMDFNNTILFDPNIKELLCIKLNIKMQELNRLLKLVESKGLIIKKGYYLYIDPTFAKKGK